MDIQNFKDLKEKLVNKYYDNSFEDIIYYKYDLNKIYCTFNNFSECNNKGKLLNDLVVNFNKNKK